jgi:hypothetical protein
VDAYPNTVSPYDMMDAGNVYEWLEGGIYSLKGNY